MDLGHVSHWEDLPDSCLEKQMMMTMVSLKETDELAVCIAKIFLSYEKVVLGWKWEHEVHKWTNTKPTYLPVKLVSTLMQCSTKLPRIGLDMTR